MRRYFRTRNPVKAATCLSERHSRKESSKKGTWKVLNSVIKRNKNFTPFPDHFENENKTYKTQQDIANGFDEFFVNIGPNLAKNIKPPINKASIYDYAHANTETYMFLHPTVEQEVLTVVNQCIGTSSTGDHGIDKYVVKKVTFHIAKPLTYICNTSFETGIFNMKVAKVIPV